MKNIKQLFLSFIVIFILSGSDTFSQTTWYISNSGGGDAPTIQIGIDLASDGDSLIVAPGTYTGIGNRDINFNGKNLILVSEFGPDVTIIDCTEDGRAFEFNNGEDSTAKLIGFTIMNGKAYRGGGIDISFASLVIENCVIKDCQSTSYHGGGLFIAGQNSPKFINCDINNNSSNSGGGLFTIAGAHPEFINCTFSKNNALEGGAAANIQSSPTFKNCTIVNNTQNYGGALYFLATSSPVFENCLIANNGNSGVVLERGPFDLPNYAEFNCCNIYGHTYGNWVYSTSEFEGINGNISLAPQFCDTANYNFTLDYSSPCLPDNNSCQELIGAFGEGCHSIHTYLSDNPLYMFMANNIESSNLVVTTNEFPPAYTINEVNLSSLIINGSLIPDSIFLVSNHPVVTDSSYSIFINTREFIQSFGFLYDESVQTLIIEGQMNDSTPFSISTEFTFVGHRAGDVNFDGRVNIADMIDLVAYFFQGGAQPLPEEVLDIDRDNAVNIHDLVTLAAILF